jgi:hypothetical protein
MEFIKYTKKLNEIALNKQNEKETEILNEEDIIKAITYLNYMLIEDTGDCLIFLSALNLCNAYVKQNNSKITYSFKKCIEYFLEIINYKNIKDLYVYKNKNNGTLFIFQIGEIQFSFHDEKLVEINEQYIKELSWDGIKKQKCAKTLFEQAINNNVRTTNKTYRGKNLKEKVEKTLENYKEKKIDIKDLLILKI